jgi:hypothetical protein
VGNSAAASTRAGTSIGPAGVHRFDPPLNPPGVPEYFMGVAGIEFDGDHTIAVLQTGPWLSWGGREVAVGNLGVLFDNVLAYPMFSGASADHAREHPDHHRRADSDRGRRWAPHCSRDNAGERRAQHVRYGRAA